MINGFANSTQEVVGYVTSNDRIVCVGCGHDREILAAHRAGLVRHAITHPAPNGVYQPGPMSHHYDGPCYICGWAIRRVAQEAI